MHLTGIHHVTAITANASANYDFYTRVLGLRLVKKSVNQDDVSAYHLFYADGQGSPGSDITFFNWSGSQARHGCGSVSKTAFRAPAASLGWWQERLRATGLKVGPITETAGRKTFDFTDSERHRLSLVANDPSDDKHLWEKSNVPVEHQLVGLGPPTLTLHQLEPSDHLLTDVLRMRKAGSFKNSHDPSTETYVFEMGGGGAAAEVHVSVEPSLPMARQGAGGVHHMAFRIPDGAHKAWEAYLEERDVPSSGSVDRFYFKSLYFREPGGVLLEIATDGPGFGADEPLDALGERLALPLFLEARRAEIEAGLKPL